jgi:hypothetical protein
VVGPGPGGTPDTASGVYRTLTHRVNADGEWEIYVVNEVRD